MSIAETVSDARSPDRALQLGVKSYPERPLLWMVALLLGAALLCWIPIANGYPMVFSDSGSYLRVGTELHYLPDRSVTYGLIIAPIVHFFGLWPVALLQAVLASWLIGQVLVAVTGARSPVLLFMVLAALAGFSSLPWFTGQIMPDLSTSMMALTLYLVVFAPGLQWTRWLIGAVAAGLISMHLSNIPIAAALIVVAGALLLSKTGWRTALSRMSPAILALFIAIFGLCTINFVAAQTFRPSVQSEKFLVAKTFDSHLGQPVLARLCQTENWQLCNVRSYVADPRRHLPGQDYLWAADTPRIALEDNNPIAFRDEEKAFAQRVLNENPLDTFRVALWSWGQQLIDARAADGMTAYPANMEVARQIHRYLPGEAAAFDASVQQHGSLRRLAWMPDRAIALAVLLALPFILLFAIRRDDRPMVALITILVSTVVVNAAVCGILSGPADRYQSRVIWLILLIGLIAAAERFGRSRLKR